MQLTFELPDEYIEEVNQPARQQSVTLEELVASFVVSSLHEYRQVRHDRIAEATQRILEKMQNFIYGSHDRRMTDNAPL